MLMYALMAVATLLIGPKPRMSPDFHWSGKIAAGKAIEIKGINGSIRAETTSGSEVEVSAVKHARKSDPDDVEIRVVEHEDGVTICAVYPSPRASRPNDCVAGEGGHSETRNNDTEVEFTVRVPARVRFLGRTVNGAVEARGLDSDLDATTVNGSITVSTRGQAFATTVNGSINATMGKADWKGDAEYTTVNGGITLTLPADFSAVIDATTVNGDVESDFPLTVTGKISRQHIRATIGAGGRELKLTTVNGSIRLRKE